VSKHRSFNRREVFAVTCRYTLLYLLVSASVALADGMFIPPEYGTAASADQRAIVIDHGATQTLILETAYQGDGAEFAWVVPLPTLIEAAGIGTVDQSVFAGLEDLTAPRAWIAPGAVSAGGSGCGSCGGGGTQLGGGYDNADGRTGVTVWETLQIEGYEVAILSAGESGDLAKWLTDNGYALPDGNEATLQYYVDAGAFFVAVKIVPEQTAAAAQMTKAGAVGATQPLRFTFPKGADGLVFPLRISQASSKGETEVRLFVFSDHRVASSSYPTAEVNASGFQGRQEFRQWYDARFRAKLGDLGGRAFVVEWAKPLPEWGVSTELRKVLGEGEFFLTRMRSYLTPELMTEDVMLARAPTDDEFEVDIYVGAQLGMRPLGGFGAMLMGGVFWRRTRTRRGRNGARFAALLGLALLLL
jgi:hypothetical protein